MLKDTNKMLRVSNASLDWRDVHRLHQQHRGRRPRGRHHHLIRVFPRPDRPGSSRGEASLFPMLEITLDLVEEGLGLRQVIGCTENGKGLADISRTTGSAASSRSRPYSSAWTATARTCARCTPTTTCVP